MSFGVKHDVVSLGHLAEVNTFLLRMLPTEQPAFARMLPLIHVAINTAIAERPKEVLEQSLLAYNDKVHPAERLVLNLVSLPKLTVDREAGHPPVKAAPKKTALQWENITGENSGFEPEDDPEPNLASGSNTVEKKHSFNIWFGGQGKLFLPKFPEVSFRIRTGDHLPHYLRNSTQLAIVANTGKEAAFMLEEVKKIPTVEVFLLMEQDPEQIEVIQDAGHWKAPIYFTGSKKAEATKQIAQMLTAGPARFRVSAWKKKNHPGPARMSPDKDVHYGIGKPRSNNKPALISQEKLSFTRAPFKQSTTLPKSHPVSDLIKKTSPRRAAKPISTMLLAARGESGGKTSEQTQGAQALESNTVVRLPHNLPKPPAKSISEMLDDAASIVARHIVVQETTPTSEQSHTTAEVTAPEVIPPTQQEEIIDQTGQTETVMGDSGGGGEGETERSQMDENTEDIEVLSEEQAPLSIDESANEEEGDDPFQF